MAIFDPSYLRFVKKKEETSQIQDGVVGVCWDYGNSSPKLTRLTPQSDPHKYVTLEITKEPVPAVGTGNGSSPFDYIRPWCEMREKNIDANGVAYWSDDSRFSRTAYDTYVWIPVFYYAVKDVPNKRYWYVSSTSRSGFSKHPGSGKFIGRYLVGKDFNSRSGVLPAFSKSFDTFRSEASRTSGRAMMDYMSYCAPALLALVEYSTWDLGRVIGPGHVFSSTANRLASGETDTMKYHTGSTVPLTNERGNMQYRWIEGLYGNLWQLVDGAIYYNGALYLATSSAGNGPSYSNKLNVGEVPKAQGVVSKIKYLSNVPWAFIPQERDAAGAYQYWTTDSYYYRYIGSDTNIYIVGDIYHAQGSGIAAVAIYYNLNGDSQVGTRWMHT